jgi:hypothetical protein
MVLDLTRELDQWPTYDSPREARAALREHYDEDRWLGQPFYPILIVEKDTMEPVCQPMAQRWQMPFASSRGYGSLKLQHDVAQLLLRLRRRTRCGHVCVQSEFRPQGAGLASKHRHVVPGVIDRVAAAERAGMFGAYAKAHRHPELTDQTIWEVFEAERPKLVR